MSTVSSSRSAIERTQALLTSATDTTAKGIDRAKRYAGSSVGEAAEALRRRRDDEKTAEENLRTARRNADMAESEVGRLRASQGVDSEGRRTGASDAEVSAAAHEVDRWKSIAVDCEKELRKCSEARARCEAAVGRINEASGRIQTASSGFWSAQLADIDRARGRLTGLSGLLDAYLASARAAAAGPSPSAAPSFGSAAAAGTGGASGAGGSGASAAATGADGGTVELRTPPTEWAEAAGSAGRGVRVDPLEGLDEQERAAVELWTRGGEAMFRRAPRPETFAERDAREASHGASSFVRMYDELTGRPITARLVDGRLEIIARADLARALVAAGAREIPVRLVDDGTAPAVPAAESGFLVSGEEGAP